MHDQLRLIKVKREEIDFGGEYLCSCCSELVSESRRRRQLLKQTWPDAMKHRNKILRIALLMIISELLIGAFVFRWLQSEYNSEKEQLQKDLFGQFMAARSRVMDSVITKKFIEPILNSPKGFKLQTVAKHGPEHPGDSEKIIITGSGPSITTQDCVKIRLSSVQDTLLSNEANLELRMEADTAGDLLYRGVKLFISEVGGPQGDGAFFEKHLMPGDTGMLKRFFGEDLQQYRPALKSVWVSDYPLAGIPPPPFYYESKFFDRPYGALIEQYDAYLIRQITPQALFALLLLLTTGAAFLFSFRSLSNQLKQAAMKDDFISNMSHELKTPVATMKVAVEAMRQMDPAEKKETMREYLGMAAQELHRLELLVNKVMNSVLMEQGEDVFHFQKINLNDLIEKTIGALELNLRQSGARVHFTSESNALSIYADPVHVQGVLFNLADNSLKYAGSSPVISIHVAEEGNEILLRFKDNGPGIADEYIDKIFTKFFRVPQGHQHNVKGYGLGLNYVAEVMKHHGGSASVHNNKTGGCEFVLHFLKHKW
jgi:signal transduction histidine kinase